MNDEILLEETYKLLFDIPEIRGKTFYKHNLSGIKVKVLAIICCKPGVSVYDIASVLGYKESSISQFCTQLFYKELLLRAKGVSSLRERVTYLYYPSEKLFGLIEKETVEQKTRVFHIDQFVDFLKEHPNSSFKDLRTNLDIKVPALNKLVERSLERNEIVRTGKRGSYRFSLNEKKVTLKLDFLKDLSSNFLRNIDIPSPRKQQRISMFKQFQEQEALFESTKKLTELLPSWREELDQVLKEQDLSPSFNYEWTLQIKPIKKSKEVRL